MQNINTGREGLAEDTTNTEQTCPLRSSAWHFQNLSVSEFYSTSAGSEPFFFFFNIYLLAARAQEGLEELEGQEGQL